MTIVHLAILWCAGIWLAAGAGIPWAIWGVVATTSTLCTLLLRSRPRMRIAALYLAIFCAGAVRTGVASTHINVDQFADYGNDPEVTLTGFIADPPRVRDTRLDVILSLESIEGAGYSARALQGRILLHAPRFPEFHYGERVRVTGTLEEIENWGNFDYREYMARQGVHRLVRSGQIVRLEQGAGHPFYQFIYDFRARAQAVVEALIPAPQSALLSGILLGDDSRMPPALRDDFRATGMSHIIAISGFTELKITI
jgi:competence protein ComEC